MTTVPLPSATGRATIAATGVAVVQLGPDTAHRRWLLTRMSVKSTSALMTTCVVTLAGDMVDATYTGNQDVSDFTVPQPVEAGQHLVFTFTGGTPTAEVVATVFGEAETG